MDILRVLYNSLDDGRGILDFSLLRKIGTRYKARTDGKYLAISIIQ